MDNPRPSFAPGNWPGWFAAGVLWFVGHLPYRLGVALAAGLAPLMRLVMKRRVAIVERNIERCFPELNPQQQHKLVHKNIRSAAIGLAEFAYSWTGNRERMQKRVVIDGVEHLERIATEERGVILMVCHMTCMEMVGTFVGEHMDAARLAGMYRPLGNAVVEWLQNRGRMRYSIGTFPKSDIRGAIRHLRGGGFLWYAPDQDFGADQSEFIPFFGIQTATLTATHKLAQLGRAEVLPMFVRRNESDTGYIIQVGPALPDIPSDDLVADLTACNQATEAWIRKAPEQYWWLHRRFKTRPEGEEPFYE
jgi:KDO2-lipid IV(A) lauroyltransferase